MITPEMIDEYNELHENGIVTLYAVYEGELFQRILDSGKPMTPAEAKRLDAILDDDIPPGVEA